MKYFQKWKIMVIKDKIKAKKYYTENYNRINKNIGSTIFSNIFNQKEKRRNFVNYQIKILKIPNLLKLKN